MSEEAYRGERWRLAFDPQPVLQAGILVLTGAYGSGKSELALNLAAYLAGRRPFSALTWSGGQAGPPPAPEGVVLLDLDTVKPYFRARELEEEFRDCGVRFLGAAEGFAHADVPAISPAVLGALRLGRERLVVDLAGEQAGARVLRGILQTAGPGRQAALLLVVNPYRPFTGRAEEIVALGRELVVAAGLPLAGVVANPQLLEATTAEHVQRGYAEVARAAGMLEAPVVCGAAQASLVDAVADRLPVPVFAVQRFLRPPWERSS